MTDTINFLYCFDENYDYQAFASMISLLDEVDEKINIHVIHTSKKFYETLPEKIVSHENLKNINVYEFSDYDFDFPNVNNVHISVATYFRLFIKNYLNNQISSFVFLDPDVVCLKNPLNDLRNIIMELKESTYVISAKTEHTMGEKRIGVDKNYFNAGVMVIDFNKWIRDDLDNKLLSTLKQINKNILHWDQDVLNSFFNGKYLELEEKFNFKASSEITKSDKNELVFIHFIGSHKPWLTSGAFQKDSNFYHENYRKISNTNFQLNISGTRSIFDLLKAILTFRIFKIKNLLFIFLNL